VVAQNQATYSPQSARSMGIASIVFSIVGIVVGIIIIIIVVVWTVVFGVAAAEALSVSNHLLPPP